MPRNLETNPFGSPEAVWKCDSCGSEFISVYNPEWENNKVFCVDCLLKQGLERKESRKETDDQTNVIFQRLVAAVDPTAEKMAEHIMGLISEYMDMYEKTAAASPRKNWPKGLVARTLVAEVSGHLLKKSIEMFEIP